MLYSHSKPAGLYSLSITNFFHCSLSRYHAHGVHDSEVQAQPLTNSQRRQRTMSMNLQNFSVRRAFVSNSKDQQHSFLASSAFAICFFTFFANLKKCLIQHCERSELSLHFECQKWYNFASFCDKRVLPDKSVL